MTRKPIIYANLLLLGALIGCATAGPSNELVDARAAYEEASKSSAAELRPDELVDAKQALSAAEEAHEEDPGSVEEQHLAYIAARRSELAMKRGQKAYYEREHEEKRSKLLSSAKAYADSARSELDQTKRDLMETTETLSEKEAALEDEREKRQEAEALAAAAMKDLSEIAKLKEESRGTVITLSGEVLFQTGKSELLNTARQRLSQVATALKQQADDKTFIIEGHTDSRGSDSYNEQLSLARAKSVKDYLVSQGVSDERLEARGVGESEPIADNSTVEGRANNRRVEIIVAEDTSGDSATTSDATARL